MIGFTYLALLLLSIASMLLIDRRFSLAFFYDKIRTWITIAIGVIVFILWDIGGIVLGIFFMGDSPYVSGILLGPEFPIEELFFLFFLCYFTLILYRLGEKLWKRT